MLGGSTLEVKTLGMGRSVGSLGFPDEAPPSPRAGILRGMLSGSYSITEDFHNSAFSE